MKKILVFAPIPLWEIHHAEVIDLIHSQAECGNIVYLATCSGTLASCPANPHHKKIKCIKCRRISKYTRSNLIPNNCIEFEIKLNKTNFKYKIDSLHDLLRVKYSNLPIGRLVASQIADNLNGVYIDLKKRKIRKKCLNLLSNGINLYLKAIELIDKLSIDEVYVWNGRRSSDGPVIFAAASKSIPYYSFISGGKTGYIHIVPDLSVQEFKNIQKTIETYKSAIDYTTKKDIGRNYFLKDIHRYIDQVGYVQFNERAVKARKIVTKKPKLLVVTSSPTEAIHMQSYVDFYGVKPFETMLKIVNTKKILDKYTVIVRWHPAKINLFHKDKEIIDKLIQKNTEILHIRPEDRDQTYDLVESSDVILSFGSTVGYVSVLLGKPVVLAGPLSNFLNNSFYPAKTIEMAQKLLLSELTPKDVSEVELYGYYIKNFGERMAYIDIIKNKSFVQIFLKNNKKELSNRVIPIHPTSQLKFNRFIKNKKHRAKK